MPYIKKEDRVKFETPIQDFIESAHFGHDIEPEYVVTVAEKVMAIGEANYFISRVVWGLFSATPSYTLGNKLISVLKDVEAYLVNKNSWAGSVHDMEANVLYEALCLLCYQLKKRLPDVRGMLECVVLEFYRRKLGPYEDSAIQKNGDIE